MKRMQWLVPMALVGAAVTLFLTVPVQAKTYVWPPLVNTGVEPDATGQYWVGQQSTHKDHDGNVVYWQALTITCQNLTPRAEYSTPLGTFTTDRKGNGRIQGKVIESPGFTLTVDRVNSDGSLTTVLCAPF
jgi:hypothetical protein